MSVEMAAVATKVPPPTYPIAPTTYEPDTSNSGSITGLWIIAVISLLGIIALSIVVFIYTSDFGTIDDRLTALEAAAVRYEVIAQTVLVNTADDSVTLKMPSGDKYFFAKGENNLRARQIYWTNNFVDPTNPYYQRNTHLRFDFSLPDKQFVPSEENTFSSNYRLINLDNTAV